MNLRNFTLDTTGEFVHVERMDGEVANDLHVALLKALTALRMRQPTSIDAAQTSNNPAELVCNTELFKFFDVSGGIPSVVDGQMIGAIGVRGGDENCAIQGLKAALGDHATVAVYPVLSIAEAR